MIFAGRHLKKHTMTVARARVGVINGGSRNGRMSFEWADHFVGAESLGEAGAASAEHHPPPGDIATGARDFPRRRLPRQQPHRRRLFLPDTPVPAGPSINDKTAGVTLIGNPARLGVDIQKQTKKLPLRPLQGSVVRVRQ